MSYNTFAGVLGGHHNYLVHMCLPNFSDYEELEQTNIEKNRTGTRDKYKELRYFLNAVESFNNILDYMYWEYEDKLKPDTDGKFRDKVHKEFPALEALADLANAYKHCKRKGKNAGKISAAELQNPNVIVSTVVIEGGGLHLDIEYEFPGVAPEHKKILEEAFRFWQDYHQKPNPEKFIKLA
ncbi:TPA: hypothetical protein ACKRRJ_001691 [Pseudomonas aeruginosa]